MLSRVHLPRLLLLCLIRKGVFCGIGVFFSTCLLVLTYPHDFFLILMRLPAECMVVSTCLISSVSDPDPDPDPDPVGSVSFGRIRIRIRIRKR